MICKRGGIGALPVKSFLITDVIPIDLSDRSPNTNSRTSAKSVSVAVNITMLML